MLPDGGRIRYRPEIDGLRTIAVFAVIFAHAGLSFVKGGHLGVDVFFVISGYLITKVLHRELSQGTFSLFAFYDRRVRRILPALNVVMLLCIPPALILMMPGDLQSFGQSLVATSLFSNNVLLWYTVDYFDLQSQFKPLLHTWSLGVEEQYYLFTPLVLWAAYRFMPRRGIVTALVLVTTTSFLFSLLLSRFAPPQANFYWVFSRAWELGAGALACEAEPWLRKRLEGRTVVPAGLAGLGLMVLLISLAVLGDAESIPNLTTLLPVLGACAVILFASETCPTGRFWRPSQWLAAD